MAFAPTLRTPTRRGMRGMGDCAWVNGSYVNVLPNGSVMGCGVPPTPPPIAGTGPAASIANEYQQVIADNPYLSSPAYLAAEAAAGAPDPGAAADAQATLRQYCSQNVFNNGIWGTPLDTATCNGLTPLPGAVATVGTVVTPNYFAIAPAGGSGTQGGGPVVKATPAPQPAPAPPAQTIQNSATNPGNNAGPALVNGQPASSSKLAIPAWFTDPTQDLIPGFQNWLLLAAGVGALFLLGKK